MRTVFCLLSVLTLSLGFAQQTLPSDWVLNDLKGNVKQVEEVLAIMDLSKVKKIYNFNDNGLLTTIVEYADYHSKTDSLAISKTHYFANTDSTRVFYALGVKYKDTTDFGKFKLKDEGRIVLEAQVGEKWKSTSEIVFSNGLLTERTNTAFDAETNTQLMRQNITNTYEANQLVKYVITNGTIEETMTVKNLKIDAFGNVLKQQHFDSKGKLVYDVSRKIIYYD